MLLSSACRSGVVQRESPTPWFRDVAAESGLDFQHITGATGQFYMPEIMGSGCGLLDYDGDGDLDIILVQGGASLEPSAGGSGSRLYRNEIIPSGKLRFTDVSLESGFQYSGYGMGVATGDINNDGRVDVLVTGYGRAALFRNDGGVFRDVTMESKALALTGRWSVSAAFLDYDRDGWQDLMVLTYLEYSTSNNQKCYAPSGEPTYCTPKVYPPTTAHLFRNVSGRFVDVTKAAGIDRAQGRGLGIAVLDVDGDGWQDVFVANDASANHLWVNQKNGFFVERALEMGVAYGDEGLAKAGMGVAPGDYDNDLDEDILVLNLMREGATLFRNTGGGRFSDASLGSGIHKITFPLTGFGVGWLDFDCDGWLDLFLANGAVTMREEQRGQPYPFRERNLLIRNAGAGKFQDVTERAGPVFTFLEVTRGAAFGDIDNDGDVDILIANNNGPARLLRNDLPPANWFTVQFQEPGLGMSSEVSVTSDQAGTLRRRVHTDGSYLSASDPRVHFGLKDSARVEEVKVSWPDGLIKNYTHPPMNSVLRVSR